VRTIIAGPRIFLDLNLVKLAVAESGFIITEVVTGDALGIDWLGAYWGYLNGIPVKHFPAKWEYWGRRAGPIRNGVMADYADALIAIWDGESGGTRDMIHKATKAELEKYIKMAGR
jgi:hypothetical protein